MATRDPMSSACIATSWNVLDRPFKWRPHSLHKAEPNRHASILGGMSIPVLSLLVAAYLLGAIPFSLVVAKTRGVDPRAHGSGNAGATNALRVLGKGPGILVFALDFLKGFAATVALPSLILGASSTTGWMVLAGTVAMLGHVFTVWGALFFGGWKGGKGVATGAGMLTGLVPWAVLAGLAVFIGTVATTRMVSLGSILASSTIPVALAVQRFAFDAEIAPAVWVFALAVPAFILWTHRANVKRIVAGTESRV